jgi:hypothetical protein
MDDKWCDVILGIKIPFENSILLPLKMDKGGA